MSYQSSCSWTIEEGVEEEEGGTDVDVVTSLDKLVSDELDTVSLDDGNATSQLIRIIAKKVAESIIFLFIDVV